MAWRVLLSSYFSPHSDILLNYLDMFSYFLLLCSFPHCCPGAALPSVAMIHLMTLTIHLHQQDWARREKREQVYSHWILLLRDFSAAGTWGSFLLRPAFNVVSSNPVQNICKLNLLTPFNLWCRSVSGKRGTLV